MTRPEVAGLGVIRRERGSVTIVVAALAALACVVTLGVADVGGALLARSRARAAADAAALAAAQELAFSTGRTPADVAQEYAERHGAVLRVCTCAPGSLEAVVEASLDFDPLLLPGAFEAVARARAVVDLPP